jgi:hypothetical protein
MINGGKKAEWIKKNKENSLETYGERAAAHDKSRSLWYICRNIGFAGEKAPSYR